MNRRWMAILTGSSLGLGFAFACSFPDVSYAPPGSGTSGTNGTSGAATSSGGSVDGAVTLPEQENKLIEIGKCVGKCDCDNDGYLVAEGCVPDAGEDANGKEAGDCDDTYDLRHPNYPPNEWRSEVPLAGGGDWNCDGRVDKLYLPLTECQTPLIGGCDQREGFRSDVKCGERSDLVHCAKASAVSSCTVITKMANVAQHCR